MRGLVKFSSLLLLCGLVGFSSGATTRHLRDIFLGRCYDYNLTISEKPLPSVKTECTTLWQLFEIAFAFKPSCGLNYTSYFPFLQAAKQDIPAGKSIQQQKGGWVSICSALAKVKSALELMVNYQIIPCSLENQFSTPDFSSLKAEYGADFYPKNLFWSGTNDFAHRLSKEGHSYATMEDTLMGYLVDSLSWCGKIATPGINYVMCPEWNDCEGNSNSVYWKASSEFFAQEAEGQVSVLLDGSNPKKAAYRRSSMFSSVELPNLDPAKVTSVNVLLMHRLGHPKLETCTSGSLVDMKQDVMARSISFTCEENPESVLHLMCSDDPSQVECNIKVVSGCPDGDGNGSSNIHFGCATWIPLVVLLSCLDIFLHRTI